MPGQVTSVSFNSIRLPKRGAGSQRFFAICQAGRVNPRAGTIDHPLSGINRHDHGFFRRGPHAAGGNCTRIPSTVSSAFKLLDQRDQFVLRRTSAGSDVSKTFPCRGDGRFML